MSEILYANVDGPSMQRNLADIALAKQMSEVLQRVYPGHSWAVSVDSQGKIATIKNYRLSGNWGFVLHLQPTYSASEYDKRVVMAAGELLERYCMARGMFRQNNLDGLKTDGLGHAGFDR